MVEDRKLITGYRLRERRTAKGVTQEEAGAAIGRGKSYISNLERGVNVPSVWPLLAELANLYDTSADYLLGLTDSVTLQEITKLSETNREFWDTFIGLSELHQQVLLIIARSFRGTERESTATERLELQELLLDQIEDMFGEDVANQVLAILSPSLPDADSTD